MKSRTLIFMMQLILLIRSVQINSDQRHQRPIFQGSTFVKKELG